MSVATFDQSLMAAPEPYREALEWFRERTGQVIPWPDPSPVPSMKHIVNRFKGIYKPEGRGAPALSVCLRLGSPYKDLPVVYHEDGSWTHGYHQEGTDPNFWTNAALKENIKSGSPIAVLDQVSKSPVRYKVLGVAIVSHWEANYFYVEGFNKDGTTQSLGVASEDRMLQASVETVFAPTEDFIVDPEHDNRKRSVASMVVRQGQGKFRKSLLLEYRNRCVISECMVTEVIDAAHLTPYLGDHTNSLQNGLLMRTDLHNLYDRGLLAIDPATKTVIVAHRLKQTEYGRYHGTKIANPIDAHHQPTQETLQAHLDWCGGRLS